MLVVRSMALALAAAVLAAPAPAQETRAERVQRMSREAESRGLTRRSAGS